MTDVKFTAAERARVLLEALPYMQAYWHKVVVIKIGGRALFNDAAAIQRFLLDVVFMEQVGIWPVLVHGGGHAISARLTERGVEPQFVDGLRVTESTDVQIEPHVGATLDNGPAAWQEMDGERAALAARFE